jgi:hypothetical protein
MSVQCTTNPYVLSLDTHTATVLHTATERQPGLYKRFINIFFFRRDPDLLRASETLRKWAIGQTTDEEQNWLENFFMKLFQDYFTPVDCPQITWEDLDFNYYGDGSFEPDSIQGVIAETAGETQIKWTFKIAPDGSNQILTIDYDGDHQFDTSNNYEPLS